MSKALPRRGGSSKATPSVRRPVSLRKMKYRPGSSSSGHSIGTSYANFVDQLALIDAGLPTAAIATFQRATGLSVARINDVAGITAGTYSRRLQVGRLSSGETERMLRLSRVFERAVDLYRGDVPAARQWLETPIPSLAGHRPLDLSRTEPGAREVEDLVGRIQHGVIS